MLDQRCWRVLLGGAAVAVIAGGGCVRLGFDAERAGGDAAHADAVRGDAAHGDAAHGDAAWIDSSLTDAPLPDGPRQPDGGKVPGEWVTIKAGIFNMGSPTAEPCRFNEEDLHQVTLTRDFVIQTTEVTQDQYTALMSGYNPSYFSSCGTCPVEDITWHESAAYCNALSSKAGATPCYACSGTPPSVTCQEVTAYTGQKIYTCPGYRLPTEAEWEYAYRAGTQTAYFNGPNDPNACSGCGSLDPKADKIAWYCANAAKKTHPVAQKDTNGWGLYDMAGNVWEWCNDRWQGNLGASPVIDPSGPATGNDRVLRGGSWYWYAYDVRAANRDNLAPTGRDYAAGFRCVRTVVP